MYKRLIPLLAILLLTVSCKSPVAVKIFSSPTPAQTATPESTATPSPTPTLPPTPTPPPAARVELAEQALFVGDYEQARREFQDAQFNTTDPQIEAAAAMGVGRALYLDENYSMAIEALNSMIAAYPDSPHTAAAYFFLARSYEGQDLYDQAAAAYGRYLELRPGTLGAYIEELRGDAYMAAGNYSAAATAYDASVNAPQEGSTVWTQLKLGRAYAAQSDFSNAIKIYLSIYETSDNDYARAQANLLMGQAYLTMDMPEQAHTRFLDSVTLFPRVYDTYTGLVQLVNDGVVVDEVSRGVVDYYAGQYGLAIDAFNRHIDATVEPDPRAYYFRGLSYMAKSEAEPAINDFEYFINTFPTHDLWWSAWDEKAYLQWAYLERYQEAANTLLEYVKQVPESPKAAEFMFMAARIQERGDLLAEAAATWELAMEQYPSGEMSFRGLFLAGVTHYRLGDYAKSLTVFQRYLVLANNPEEQSTAYVWIGKSHQAAGDQNAAKSAWEQGAQLDPTGYYSERANELLQGGEPFTVTQPVDLGYDLAQERQEADDWMRSTFELPADLDLNGLGELTNDARVQRGLAFWELGLYNQARNEFESLRQAVSAEPVSTYRLMNKMLELGLYRSAILASRQVLDLANMDDIGTLKAPAYFNHIRFGAFFKDEVLEASQSEGFHPLFVLSVLRQESLFEGFAISSAGARGLMQIMPATGHEIASSMSWPEGYTEDDLYRPHVSIRLGARYLARQRDYFGNAYAALAAYNGGPGNTILWNEMANNDPDLLLEVIRADETRKYIIQIYEFFNIYRILYQRGE